MPVLHPGDGVGDTVSLIRYDAGPHRKKIGLREVPCTTVLQEEYFIPGTVAYMYGRTAAGFLSSGLTGRLTPAVT